MNIRIKDKSSILEKICHDTNQTPSEIVETFVDALYPLYLEYKNRRNAEIEKRSFNQILSDFFKHMFNYNVENLEIAPKLIEITNSLLGIKTHMGASIFDIKLDFDKRAISYHIGYQTCATSTYLFTAFAISVELNQDYIQISQLVFKPLLENTRITDDELRETEALIQEFVEDTFSKELLPYVNLSIHLYVIGSHPFSASSDLHQHIQIELTFKADSANHVPSMEKMGTIANVVQLAVTKELLRQ